MKMRIKQVLCAVLLLCLLTPSHMTLMRAAGKTLPVFVSRQKVKLGKTIRIKSKIEGASFSSGDTAVATVDDNGQITGKKVGMTTILVKKKGYETKRIGITVTANGNYPSIPVTLDEIDLSFKNNKSESKALIANKSRTGDIRKIEYVCQVAAYHKKKVKKKVEAQPVSPSAITGGVAEPQEEQEVTGSAVSQQQYIYVYKWEKEKKNIKFKSKQIRAGETGKAVVRGDFGDPDKLKITVKSVKLYTGKLLLNYSKTGKLSVQWGVKDKKAPVITGWVGSRSHNSKDVYMVVYPDKKQNLTKYVQAVDDRDGKVAVKADTSAVNWKRSGVYPVTYIAKDKSGNTAKATARVQVRTVSSLDQMADSILASIIHPSWSDKAKAEAIYRYVRRNYSYVDSNDHASWENSALYGLRYKSGNCFVFYSVSRLLLTRAGIPNIEVKRSAGSIHGHWWNYVYVQGGWYHFDTTPRRVAATFCLVTDAQLTAYSNSAGNSHIWNKSLLPAGATIPISSIGWGRTW